MGRRKPGISTPQQTNNSIEDLLGNEENEYPIPDLSRVMIIRTNEPNNIHKKSLKEEIMNGIIEILMENRKYRINSNNIKTPQIKNLR
jgi:hypothetical protein